MTAVRTAEPIFNDGDPVPTHYSVPSGVVTDLIFFIGTSPAVDFAPAHINPVVYMGKLKRIPQPGDKGNLFGLWASRAITKSELKTITTDALAMWQTMWPDNSTGTGRDPIRYGMQWAPGALIEG
jgi:hypothetical protein